MQDPSPDNQGHHCLAQVQARSAAEVRRQTALELVALELQQQHALATQWSPDVFQGEAEQLQ